MSTSSQMLIPKLQGTMSSRFNVKFVRSFSRDDQTKLGCGAIFGCLFMTVGFLAVLKTCITPPPSSNLQLSVRAGLSMVLRENISSSWRKEIRPLENKLICTKSDPRSDMCEIYGDIRVNGNSSKIFVVMSPQMGLLPQNGMLKIKPYARKKDRRAMANVHEMSLEYVKNGEEAPKCTQSRKVPALIFSTGGYTGNLFHDFTDVLVPLFLTSHKFNREVQFLVTNQKPWWINKYHALLKELSNYEIIDLDRENFTNCYTGVVVGLRSHKEMSIDPLKPPYGYSMNNFTRLLRGSYSLERETAIRIGGDSSKKPRLLIISRKKTRRFMNVREIIEMATNMGYEVVVAEANATTTVSDFSRIVNSCDVMIGVHGAGLTNFVFLPSNAVFIQIIPLGGLEWFSRNCYKESAEDMKLRYVEYEVSHNESSLVEQYPPDHQVLRDPSSIHKEGWSAIKSIYLDKQDVKLDVGRFSSVLSKALDHLHQSF